MTMLSARIRFIVGALALLFVVTATQPLSAQQRNPDNSVNPTASAVKEDQFLRELNRVQGRVQSCQTRSPASSSSLRGATGGNSIR